MRAPSPEAAGADGDGDGRLCHPGGHAYSRRTHGQEGHKKRARKKSKANHGNRPNA